MKMSTILEENWKTTRTSRQVGFQRRTCDYLLSTYLSLLPATIAYDTLARNLKLGEGEG